MRILSIFVFLPLLGCAGSPVGDAIAGPEKLAQADDNYCKSIGFKFGTPNYANCRLTLTQQRQDRHLAAVRSFQQTTSDVATVAPIAPVAAQQQPIVIVQQPASWDYPAVPSPSANLYGPPLIFSH
jgi:hypothetical protein